MRLNQDLIMPLVADMHPVHQACLFFRMRCLSHRLINFGFEAFVNELSPVELLVLSCLMPTQAHNRLIIEAHAKGDEKMKEWITENAAFVFPEVPSGN